MKLFKWIKGRQDSTQYKKLCFLCFKFLWWGFDGYLLKYEPNQQLAIHKDPVDGGNHYRLNIKLSGKCKFWSTSTIWQWGDKIIFFRPDLFFHNLVTQSKVLKISLGYVKFKTYDNRKSG